MCPEEAIKIVLNDKKGTYEPKLIEGKCKGCGICLEVCPGHEVDFRQVYMDIFSKEPSNNLIGNCLACYTGYSTNYDIRYYSSSGGLVTQLLLFALENGIIDGALVTRMKKEDPLNPDSFIARTKEEIIEAQGSKYCPVPSNIVLNKILKSKEGERFAVVGLPCQIHGVRKAQKVNKILKERIVLCFGLFCGAYSNFNGIEFLLDSIGVKSKDITCINFRGLGWPGNLSIIGRNGINIKIPYVEYSSTLGSAFFPVRCTLCIDALNEFADISFGDAWLKEYLSDSIGTSICIARTSIGLNLLKKAKIADKISLTLILKEKLIESQSSLLKFKKRDQNAHRLLCNIMDCMALPEYHLNEHEIKSLTKRSFLASCSLYIQILIGKNRFLWSVLRIISKVRSKGYSLLKPPLN